MADVRERALSPGHAGQDAPQRGRAGPVRDRPRLRRPPTSPADHQMLIMEALKPRRAGRYGLQATLHEKPFADRERLRQAQQLVDDGHGHRRQPARSPGRDAHEHAVPGLPAVRSSGPWTCTRRSAAGVRGIGGQRPPPGRQRGAAGDHLDLPRRHADRPHRAARDGNADPHDPRRRHGSGGEDLAARSRGTPATGTARRRSPSPATSSSSGRSAPRPPRRGPTR